MAKPVIRELGEMARSITALARRDLYNRPPDVISTIDTSKWPNPSQPVAPIGPPNSAPLAWPFWYGQNLNFTPRPDAEYSAADLRGLAIYPVARLCIENTKDLISTYPIQIQLKPVPGENHIDRQRRAKDDKNIQMLSDLFEYPDGEHAYSDWVRPLLEDLLTIDAPTCLVRRSFNGKVQELRPIPGDNITRYVDDNGFTPKPPDPAYAQLWEGVPRVNLTTDQLLYRPRNIVPRNTISSYLYGFSPVEQVAEEIKIGIARLKFVAEYYTSGSIPDAIQVVPSHVDPAKIKEAMMWMNSELAGNLQARRQWRMIQGFNMEGKNDQILFPKEKLLADPFDDLHIRKICFAFGASPQRLMRQMNRASAVSTQDAAEEEGTRPFTKWLQSFLNYILVKVLKLPAYEIVIKTTYESDVLKKARADKMDIDTGLYSINEKRDQRGDDPRPEPEANMLGRGTPKGFIPIGTTTDTFIPTEPSVSETDASDTESEIVNEPR